MKEVKTKMIILSLLGAVIGLLIPPLIHLFGGYSMEWITDGRLFFLQVIGSGLFGALSMGGSAVYDIESWGLLKATLIHYFVTLGAFILASFLLQWFSLDVILYAVAAFTVIYFIIWIIQYSIYKKEVKKMNRDLQEMLHQEK